MRTLYASTEDFIKVEKSRLSADVAAGSSVTLTLEDNNGMINTDFIVIGEEGTELAELQQINAAVSGNTSVQVATLKFSHKAGDPVTKYRFNKRKFYGATSATGSYTELTSEGSPVSIKVDDPQGTLLEYTDSVYTYFKSTYYNTEDGVETDLDDSEAVLGDQSLRYTTVYAIRKQAGMVDNPFITDGIIETYRKRAENEVNSYLYARYYLPLTNSTTELPEVPSVIENATQLLAAGYMDYREYGKDGEGVKWLGEARGLLKAIQNGTQRLIDSDYNEFELKTLTQGIQSFPNSSDPTDDSAPKFTMNQQF